MRKLFLHVGFAKCGSTSLQTALMKAPNIVFPKCGNHGGEHLAFALAIRGIDDWTRQYFDDEWIQLGLAGQMEEIRSSQDTVVLSSERLAAMSEAEIVKVSEMFPDFDIQVIIVKRDVQRYLSSTWRHAVYHHDYCETYETFLERFKDFSFGNAEEKFSSFFPVHCLDVEAPDFPQSIGNLLKTTVEFSHTNVGVSLEFANILQKTHALLGSVEFKKRFDAATKELMLDVWRGQSTVEIEPLDAILF